MSDSSRPLVPSLKALGALNMEICVKLEMPGRKVSAGYSMRPPFQPIVVDARRYPDQCTEIANRARVDNETLACTLPLSLPTGAFRWPTGTLKALKIKVSDRFLRHRFCVEFHELGQGTVFVGNVAPGLHALLTVNKNELRTVQLAFDKKHLQAEKWKGHVSLFYSLTPRGGSDDRRGADSCVRLVTCSLDGCDAALAEMEMCPCGEAYYCSVDHAASDWKLRHHSLCTYSE